MGIEEEEKKDTPTSQLAEQSHRPSRSNNPIFEVWLILMSMGAEFAQSEQRSVYCCIFRNLQIHRLNYFWEERKNQGWYERILDRTPK